MRSGTRSAAAVSLGFLFLILMISCNTSEGDDDSSSSDDDSSAVSDDDIQADDTDGSDETTFGSGESGFTKSTNYDIMTIYHRNDMYYSYIAADPFSAWLPVHFPLTPRDSSRMNLGFSRSFSKAFLKGQGKLKIVFNYFSSEYYEDKDIYYTSFSVIYNFDNATKRWDFSNSLWSNIDYFVPINQNSVAVGYWYYENGFDLFQVPPIYEKSEAGLDFLDPSTWTSSQGWSSSGDAFSGAYMNTDASEKNGTINALENVSFITVFLKAYNVHHWDGQSWSTFPIPSAYWTLNHIRHVVTVGPNEEWYIKNANGPGVLIHHVGNNFSTSDLPGACAVGAIDSINSEQGGPLIAVNNVGYSYLDSGGSWQCVAVPELANYTCGRLRLDAAIDENEFYFSCMNSGAPQNLFRMKNGVFTEIQGPSGESPADLVRVYIISDL
jgi:hypothetical protein